MDVWIIVLNAVSVALLGLTLVLTRWALLGFRQSKQALREAASYVSVIVSALSSRIEGLEGTIGQLRKEFSVENHRSMNLEDAHGSLQSKYDELSKQMQELIANDKKLLLNFEQIQSRLTTPIPIELAAQVRSQLPEDAALNRLTVTERGTLQMLSQGALPASELGRRLNKSREHMARLMKKLYLEGYVDREPERPPFRYKLNDRLRSSLGDSVSALPSEKT